MSLRSPQHQDLLFKPRRCLKCTPLRKRTSVDKNNSRRRAFSGEAPVRYAGRVQFQVLILSTLKELFSLR